MSEDKKFILMNLDDDRSKKVAEAISNPSCKKILDYIAGNKEKSEEDIAKDLNMPINTVEYNLKKLLEAGLIEKSKNFFWSKRGKKINLYKPANRHIVISPKSKRPDMNILKTIVPVIFAAIIAVVAVLILSNGGEVQNENAISNDYKTFDSMSELEDFLKENQDAGGFYRTFGGAMREQAALDSGAPTAGMADAEAKSSADDYSTTNIQVEGVDEADIVKNDGKYIYFVSGNKVIILNAFPAEEMEILSEINVTGVVDLFINEDKLVIFSNDYKQDSTAIVSIYDISDRGSPELEHEVSVDGYYVTSRMIGDYVYLVANKYAGYDGPVLPMVAVDGVEEKIAVTEIAYFPVPDTNYVFTNILAINIDDGDYSSKTYLAGASHTTYVSENNIYLTYTKTVSYKTYFEDYVKEVVVPLVPSSIGDEILEIMTSKENKPYYERIQEVSQIIQEYSESLRGQEKEEFDRELFEKTEEFSEEFQKKTEKTVVHKIEVDDLDISYITNGEVPGHLLNQYSMDEHEGNFRVATTTGNSWSSRGLSLNHMYVLNEDLEIIGSVDNLAKGERIYSTRFIGDRAYMVTFRQVDPLFVIDLSDPENPEVLGELKVTGFSNYLHPYDENHVIGIGKEASEEGRVQGLKIALFDVTDVANPVERAKYEVKQQWSDSNALYDPKAFLFNKERELLVLPVTYSEPIEEIKNEWGRYWNYNYWQGAFVFKINTEEISLRGKIDHDDNVTQDYYWNAAVQRSLFMDDTLYTISQKMVKANSLIDLSEVESIELPYEEIYYYAYATKGSTGVGVAVDAPVPDGAVE